MIKRFYAANDGKAILQVSTELGKNNIQISVGNDKLDWFTIKLDKKQSVAFKQFMRKNDI